MVTHPAFKFFIGFTAGACAAIFPKVANALSMTEDTTIFAGPFVQWTILFASLIGLVMMILEWNLPKEPAATFMAALGIPALLAGGVNTTVDNMRLDKVNQKNEQLTQVLSETAEIPTLQQKSTSSEGSPTGRTNRSPAFQLTTIAYAAEGNDFQANPAWVTVQALERRYMIVLDSAPDVESARQKADTIRKTKPGLETEIMRNGDEYLIIESGRPMTKSDALLRAVRIKQNGLNPQLLEIK